MSVTTCGAGEQRVTKMDGSGGAVWHRKGMVAPAEQEVFCRKDTGYRGIWHGQTPLDNEYKYKYSGGLGTYCAKHRSLGVYSAEAKKTFFCYGGTSPEGHAMDMSISAGKHMADIKLFGPKQLWHMVSYFDHETGEVARPTILLDKWTGDPHDNPVLSMDDKGYLYVFSPTHGTWTSPSFIHRSVEPYSIDKFETVLTSVFCYPQPWFIPGKGFVLMHTQYEDGKRWLAVSASPDGRTWTRPRLLAHIERGQYQISNVHDGRIVTAFNYHPQKGGLEARTNLYVMQSDDFGTTWTTVTGETLTLPLDKKDNPALVKNYEKAKRLVYMKDLVFDHEGNPLVLYITSGGNKSGPKNDPRTWTVARWMKGEWIFNEITNSDSNYDMGSLYVEGDGTWRLIAPTGDGPQPYNPGGEMQMWTSADEGAIWNKLRDLTAGSERNHTYARRPVNAHPDFYAFWADGHGREPSISRLYYCNKAGDVFVLPETMKDDTAKADKLLREK